MSEDFFLSGLGLSIPELKIGQNYELEHRNTWKRPGCYEEPHKGLRQSRKAFLSIFRRVFLISGIVSK